MIAVIDRIFGPSKHEHWIDNEFAPGTPTFRIYLRNQAATQDAEAVEELLRRMCIITDYNRTE
jgi:hypothetical protein